MFQQRIRSDYTSSYIRIDDIIRTNIRIKEFIMPKRISVKSESQTGRNELFHDNFKNRDMSRDQFVSRIKHGEYENYHVRKINGVETPASNPDKNRNNNLG